MKAVIIAVLLAVAMSAPLLTKEFVHQINQKQTQWKASIIPKFANLSKDQLKGLLGVKVPQTKNLPKKVSYAGLREYADVPTDFDMRTKWPNCKLPVRDQGQCGSCWAFGATEAFEDRLCIATQGKTTLLLAPQELVNCDTQDQGCDGGWPVNAWQYIEDSGLPTEDCVPYEAQDDQCTDTCQDGSAKVLYTAKDVRTYNSLDDVKTDLMTNGPVETWFAVYEDFFSYTDGIYSPQSSELAGYHAVEVLGWGVQDGTNYWIAANSWGADWGMQGYFNIEAGTCQFDEVDHFVAGDPNPKKVATQ
jgi:cathepsin B